jgi:hypothetical protein
LPTCFDRDRDLLQDSRFQLILDQDQGDGLHPQSGRFSFVIRSYLPSLMESHGKSG